MYKQIIHGPDRGIDNEVFTFNPILWVLSRIVSLTTQGLSVDVKYSFGPGPLISSTRHCRERLERLEREKTRDRRIREDRERRELDKRRKKEEERKLQIQKKQREEGMLNSC